MDNTLYDYSPIVSRPKLTWPDGARVAFYAGLNIEHYEVDKPSTSIFPGTAALAPDPLNYGWRDYALRVGIWRLIETLDRFKLPATVLLNSDCCRLYPQVIEAGRERGWAWLAHGKNNSIFQAGMTVDEERAYLADVVGTIAEATGQDVRGWLGPALTETFETPRLLRELGLTYLLDWCADDQPFPLNIPGMISVPYSIELNDVTMFLGKSLTGEQFYQMVVDQFDQLYADGEQTGRVMALCLHPFIINQPFRHKYLVKALEYIAGHEGVWLTTADEIAAYYADQ
ncbi:Polysaccharide deacetylase [Lutimaribacter pacificus]|uniref:Chitooligosaccharide deacetylase n=1 Tax=Lutimaribacter pacificus TaxID=391948 RepID=A0A1H0L2C0_9RHOB|nr:polysaccharide deacetylase family protein [Lutimaribacter pacificus]SDO62163.1 Polysaccharide deacetylase [Lutimaribacter pacificus]SHK71666.1 Polysaccharide deacetylase [Lutimaribacter pacificus]